MNEYRVEQKLSELNEGMKNLRKGVDAISFKVNPEDLWDNTDIIKNWHVSERTLATWRTKGLITYTKVGKKIFYDRADRDAFIRANKKNNLKTGYNESILHN